MASVFPCLMLLVVAAAAIVIGVYGPTPVFQDVLTAFGAVSRVNGTDIPPVTSLLHTGLGYINITFLLVFSLLSGLIYTARRASNFLFNPFELYGNEAETAYDINRASQGKTREERVREMKRVREIGEIPPVYPNGWFVVIRSDELKKGDTKCVNVLGMNLAVFRGESGRSYIVDAYCPHLGANLGIGGTVDGDRIACPFHGWTFSGDDGKCVKIAYAEKVPEFAKVKTHRSLEINHLIMIWYHAEGEQPSWFPPEIEEVKSGKWIYQGFSTVFFDCHLQDIAENHGDASHLNYVHATKYPLRGLWNIKFSWKIHEEQKHINVGNTRGEKGGTNKSFGSVTEQIGPGLTYVYDMHSNDKPQNARFIVSNTPVGPMRQRNMTVGYSGTGIIDRIVTKIMVKRFFEVVSADIVIWANKIYRPKPPLIKEDRLINEHRRWFAQFYTENSPRYAPKTSLEW